MAALDNLTIAIIQANLIWEDKAKNLANFADKINKLDAPVDLIILPEMFSTGFSMTPSELAEPMTGNTVIWMKRIAQKTNSAIIGSVIISKAHKYYNRLLFVKPDGTIEQYDKVHLFTMAGEGDAYTAGATRQIIEYRSWKICPLICYDLRFPELARNKKSDIDLLIYVANWPNTRSEHWRTLLRARAIENQCFTVGVNRVGDDNNGLKYSGDSAVLDPLGTSLVIISGQEETAITTLKKDELSTIRTKLPFLKDQKV